MEQDSEYAGKRLFSGENRECESKSELFVSALDDGIIRQLEPRVAFENHLALVIDPKRKGKLIFAQRKFEKIKIPSRVGWDELKRTGNGVRAFTLFALKAALKWDQTKFGDHADALLEIDSATGSGSWIDILYDARMADALKWRTMLFRRGFKAESDAELIAKAEIQHHILRWTPSFRPLCAENKMDSRGLLSWLFLSVVRAALQNLLEKRERAVRGTARPLSPF